MRSRPSGKLRSARAAAVRLPRRRSRWAAGALLVLAAAAAAAQQSSAGVARFAANGCHQCHGYEGQGGVAGPRIAPSPYPYAAFAALVRKPASEMPAYAGSVLSESDLRSIYDYVRAIPEPPAVDELPALR